MTGPEHYIEAERLLRVADMISFRNDDTNPAAALTLAEAQVHAMLALAAATITAGAMSVPGGDTLADVWHRSGVL